MNRLMKMDILGTKMKLLSSSMHTHIKPTVFGALYVHYSQLKLIFGQKWLIFDPSMRILWPPSGSIMAKHVQIKLNPSSWNI